MDGMNAERVQKLLDRSKNLLDAKCKQAMERRLYGEIVVKVTFESGVPQIVDVVETAKFKD